ncbi:ABC transporter substrate-binding protein [Virgibacillus necropolis]|uniref:ABC transporter substrate-binding protein n=1 Tax=Virgibacillus necropolis TaxID=163877 RepID=A0A221MAB2_9BACI|nr:ABC transporter substrate-binding protein [Virgibacillus necropolis]ASN04598.1 ABC transporter substrate-binding protein [Virgibacillus necropolis]
MGFVNKGLGILWIVVLATLLVACSNSDSGSETGSEDISNNDTSTEADEATDEEVTIVYARNVDSTGAINLVIEAFEEKFPNINVEYREMPADSGQTHDQYVTAFSAQSTEIDVFNADVIWPAEFGQADYALELDRFIEKDGIDMDAYFPGTVASGKYNGKQWAMPNYTDAGVLFYRSDIVETPPKTWDELMEMAAKYQGEKGTDFGYIMQAAQYEGLITNAIEYIASYGGQIIDEDNNVVADSAETIKAIKKMQDVVNSDFVPDNILNFKEVETETAYIEGKSVFARNWPYMQASAADEERSKIVGNSKITTLPAGDAGSASSLGGWMAMINRYSEHPEAAWEFVKFLTGTEGQKITAIYGGRAPTLKALYDDPEVKEASPLFANPEFTKVLESAVSRPVTPIYPKISDIMQIELSKALTGDQTAEETAKNMQAKITEAVNE